MPKGILIHHGILGQKWGKKNGPPYPLPAANHSTNEKKAGWKKSLDSSKNNDDHMGALAKRYADDYRNNYNGAYTDDTAKKAGIDKAKIMKRVAIGAGVVVGASIAAYVYKQYGLNFADDLIKNGATLQTLSIDPDRMAKGEAFFTAYKDADKIAYKAMFGVQQANIMGIPFGPKENKHIITAMVNNNIRIAGNHTGNKVFNELIRSNDVFRNGINALKRSPDAKIFKNERWPFMSDYELFNGVGLADDNYTKLQKIFYKRLKELGYGAVTDINDRKFSGYNTAAAIIFDRSNINKPVSSILKDDQILIAKGQNVVRIAKNILSNPLSAIAGSAGVMSIIGNKIDERNYKKYAKKSDEKE